MRPAEGERDPAVGRLGGDRLVGGVTVALDDAPRPYLGAVLLGYYTDDGNLTYAGRMGTGMPDKALADLQRRLAPLARNTAPLDVLPPRKTRFGSPLVLSRVHWVEPKLVAEITYLTWTADTDSG